MLNPFARGPDPHALAVGMAGVKMGDRLVQIGCAHAGRLGAIAVKVGLSGRAVAIVADEAAASRARKGAAAAGVLVEIDVAPPSRLPLDDDAFDVAVVDDTAGLFSNLRPEDRVAAVRELRRVLRPGGRAVVIGTAPRGGLGALLGRPAINPEFQAKGGAVEALKADGFVSVRTLAEREGLSFVEGVRPRG
jgi:ubiquinone/menaquinone biosynthesis C-methylase UbiE